MFDNNNLVVACWGHITNGFKTDKLGYLLKINLKTKIIKKFFSTKPIGNLDGIVFDNKGGYFVTDWVKGKLFRVDDKGIAQELIDFQSGSADLEFISHESLIIIPMMKDNSLLAYREE